MRRDATRQCDKGAQRALLITASAVATLNVHDELPASDSESGHELLEDDLGSGAQNDMSVHALPSAPAADDGTVVRPVSHRGLGLWQAACAQSTVCDVEVEEQQTPVTFRRTPANRFPGRFLSAEVEQMLQRRQELALGTQRDGSGGDIEFDEEADLTPASDLGDADYEPPKNGDVELLSGEEEVDMASESEGSKSAPVSTVRQSSSFRGRVARKRKVNDDGKSHRAFTCVVPGCCFVKQNLRRHLRGGVHKFTNQQIVAIIRESKLAKLAADDTAKVKVGSGSRQALSCPLLGETLSDTTRKCTTAKTQRLDQHLVSKHNLARNSDAFKHAQSRALREAEANGQRTFQTLQFDEIVRQYTDTAEGRSTGKKQTANTSLSHRSALKLLLPEISRAGLQRLMAAGDKNGYIDTLIQEQKIKPMTLQVYLASVRKFLL